jgi:hypothetical protein
VTRVAAAWLCVALVACAMGSKKAAMAPATAQPPQATTESPHDEIARLSSDIEQQRTQIAQPAPAPMSAGSETCTSVCTLKDSICKSSARICELADGMPGDDWAAGKCSDAKQACDDAKKRCTDCSS